MCIIEANIPPPVLNNSMSKLWDKIKKELKRGCTISMSSEFMPNMDYAADIVLHSAKTSREVYFTADVYDFEYEYVRRKLETKKWNKFIHKQQ